jgi:hypothetical protein
MVSPKFFRTLLLLFFLPGKYLANTWQIPGKYPADARQTWLRGSPENAHVNKILPVHQ